MKSLTNEKTTLHERIEKIEKQNRRLKSYMVVLFLSLLALVVMGAKAGTQDGHFRQIIAEGISIVDGEGQEIILIGSRKEGTGIRILNKTGKSREKSRSWSGNFSVPPILVPPPWSERTPSLCKGKSDWQKCGFPTVT